MIQEELLRLAYGSTAAMAVAPMQDLLGLGAESRMNTPGRPGGNWGWRVLEEQLSEELAVHLRELAHRYSRDGAIG